MNLLLPRADTRNAYYGLAHCHGPRCHDRCLLIASDAGGIFGWLKRGVVLPGKTTPGSGLQTFWWWDGKFQYEGHWWVASHTFIGDYNVGLGRVSYQWNATRLSDFAHVGGDATADISEPGIARAIEAEVSSGEGYVASPITRYWVPYWADPRWRWPDVIPAEF